MQLLSEWRRASSRKRAAEESSEESSRKRTRDDNGRRGSTGIGTGNILDQEYKIRGNSTAMKDGFHHPSSPLKKESASSPVATEPLPSPPIHPDRRANFFNAAPAPALAPAPASAFAPGPLGDKADFPPSPLSRSPEHINNTETEEQRTTFLPSPSHPNLRIDTIRTLSSFDPRGPDYSPAMTSHSNEKSRPSHDPRKPLNDSYPYNANPPPRRKSDIMPPPTNATKITRSEASTPKLTSSPTNSDLERRQFLTTQPQIPLLDSLNGFAQNIMSAASLTVRRDLIKQQAVGQQKERDRQAKFKSTFLTLIEDAEARVEGVEKVAVGIEKQIDLSSEAQTKIVIALASQLQEAEISDAPSSARDQGLLKDAIADMKADLKAAKKEMENTSDRSRFKEHLADIKADLKAAGKDIDYLNREAVMPDKLHKKLRGLATKDELQGLVTKDELRRVTTDEVRKHVTEALVPTEKKLASLIVENANLNQKTKGVEVAIHKHHETAEERDQQQSSRFGRLDTSLNDMQMELSRLELILQEQRQDYATVKVDLGAQDKALTDLDTYVRRDPSDDDPSLETLVLRNSDQIQLLQQDCEKLDNVVRQTQDLQAASIIESSPQVSNASAKVDTSIEEEVKLIRHGLDALEADREKVALIRTDLDSLINEEKLKDVGVAEGFEVMEMSLNKQREDLARLQNEFRVVKQSQASQTVPNHPPTPPFASASTSPREPDHQKLQDVEIWLTKLTKTTQGLELFVNSQQQKFDGLTSDRVVQSMVHQMQQMYPHHPGNLLALLNQTVARQTRVDSYLSGNLKDRLANIESQMAARVDTDSKIEEITQFTTESRKILLATIHSLKQDIEGLKEVAINNRPQETSDHGNRIDELADRVTAVEAKYVKAIGDFQANQTDLIRNVTHLQFRNATGSARNTPGELTVVSRSSKSVEPNGNTLSFENVDHSNSSDTSSSQRSSRGVRRDREERRPSDPNLKRKAVDSDDEDEGEDARPTNAKKVPRRRNVSGKNPFS
ncbi:hypothetical protein HO133_003745 [Letharia lupina]|uniref:Uncharacterized protein n=1 Tax=Letharia lupina TaxID=560253 RepID=A0A8H6F9A0_9LECA|nr:uncharacterized protein HO133_003745 [Letharia lupina]KAF6219920.1 hypothetical protein HO133_003745 [Letharia lupina]